MRAFMILAILGAILPYVFFVQVFATEGLNFGGLIPAIVARGGDFHDRPALQFARYLAGDVRPTGAGQESQSILFIVLKLTIGLSCGLPACLYANTEAAK